MTNTADDRLTYNSDSEQTTITHCIEKTSIHSRIIKLYQFYLHSTTTDNSTQSKPPRTTPFRNNGHVRNIRSWTLHTTPSFHLGSQPFVVSVFLRAPGYAGDLYIKDNAKQRVEGRKKRLMRRETRREE